MKKIITGLVIFTIFAGCGKQTQSSVVPNEGQQIADTKSESKSLLDQKDEVPSSVDKVVSMATETIEVNKSKLSNAYGWTKEHWLPVTIIAASAILLYLGYKFDAHEGIRRTAVSAWDALKKGFNRGKNKANPPQKGNKPPQSNEVPLDDGANKDKNGEKDKSDSYSEVQDNELNDTQTFNLDNENPDPNSQQFVKSVPLKKERVSKSKKKVRPPKKSSIPPSSEFPSDQFPPNNNEEEDKQKKEGTVLFNDYVPPANADTSTENTE
jgi:hypothetical protein